MNDGPGAAGLRRAWGGTLASEPLLAPGWRCPAMAARPSGLQKRFLVRLRLSALPVEVRSEAGSLSGSDVDEGLPEQQLSSPQPQFPSPAAAWAICRSTCQEQNANPHRRRCARGLRACQLCVCVCVHTHLCVAQQSLF